MRQLCNSMPLGIDKQKEQQTKKPEVKQTQETQKPKNDTKSNIESFIPHADRKYSEEEKINFKQESAPTTNSYIDKTKFNQIYPPIKYKTEAYWIFMKNSGSKLT